MTLKWGQRKQQYLNCCKAYLIQLIEQRQHEETAAALIISTGVSNCMVSSIYDSISYSKVSSIYDSISYSMVSSIYDSISYSMVSSIYDSISYSKVSSIYDSISCSKVSSIYDSISCSKVSSDITDVFERPMDCNGSLAKMIIDYFKIYFVLI